MLKRITTQLNAIRDKIEEARGQVESLCESERLQDAELDCLEQAQDSLQSAFDALAVLVPA